MLKIDGISKTFYAGTVNEKLALKNVSLAMKTGDFITVIGGNGAGKSTLLNSIAGVFKVDCGKIYIDDIDVTSMSEHKRAAYIGRVFQDPMLGTAADMMVEENLAIAARRGKKLSLRWSFSEADFGEFKAKLTKLALGLEDRLKNRIGTLSGGQRQAITLLMATLRKPKLLLLDEHTAALDPKTAEKVLELTQNIVAENGLTTLMITHNMRDALRFGNRLLMLDDGKIILDIHGAEKAKMTVHDLLDAFEHSGGGDISDRMLLS
ncbi:ATP-binding cassette domain-containing protein|uniref:Putative ABC transport system ATP-binding protein n=1 Tax=Dendrosporobacter quercicolus TaxID=146817 RepID=A0A1G9TSD7_9FIRM|nr:ATP-binding cassette domain-containing protein [Dendrosporobacter quercicolus]NSL48866.1 ATP-binding cassette domain-containing protein [Dendrosporobacter quercicolus DSM 1736]SDM50649.1 putative ABC transport system ATP-binding protein [Dendrosporobacter quercicolus]